LVAKLEEALVRFEQYGSGRLRQAIAKARIYKLNARERGVLIGMAAGQSNRRMSAWLSISPLAVKAYRAIVQRKLSAKNPAEVIRIAADAHYIEY